jgi:hypothetical protein
VVVHTLGRALLIASGLYLLGGERKLERLPRLSLGAALAIEVFALSWAAYQLRTPSQAVLSSP